MPFELHNFPLHMMHREGFVELKTDNTDPREVTLLMDTGSLEELEGESEEIKRRKKEIKDKYTFILNRDITFVDLNQRPDLARAYMHVMNFIDALPDIARRPQHSPESIVAYMKARDQLEEELVLHFGNGPQD